ncbi:hypothetical protein [Methanoplanus limicola]|uniref:Uncharacterized protein n=1 Tax=Methanoplanus limicola DSM 2279 TaxID=937775 RepID=H1Z1A9_9EURY|nr:hypothetical protein [Methanoplanus limicola]EHQ35376.1 hypothetical protein Metlim_1267 [Methanoplanus limicola DSM 2279]
MSAKQWKTEYSYYGTRIAKGLGASPEEADQDARRQLEDKKILKKRCNR